MLEITDVQNNIWGKKIKTNYIYFKHIFVTASSITMDQSTLFPPQSKLALNLADEIIFKSTYDMDMCIWGFEAVE